MPTMEFISTGFECSSVSLHQYLGRGQVQKSKSDNCSYDKNDDILIVSAVLPQHLIAVEVNLTGQFVVGGLRVCLSGLDTAIDNGRYTVQTLDQVLSVDAVTNIEMSKIINRTAANSVNAESRETFTGISLPTWTTDKSSLWDSHADTSTENECRRSLNWRLPLIFEMRQLKFYVNNVMSERWSGCDGWEPYIITPWSAWADYFEEDQRNSHVIKLLSFRSCDLEFESAFVLRRTCLKVDWNGSNNWFVPIIKGDYEVASWIYPREHHFQLHWLIEREKERKRLPYLV